MPSYEIIFFEKKDGTSPPRDFLDSLDKKMRAKMLKILSMLEENGIELREPYTKYLQDEIFEVRAKLGSDITRVLYFYMVGGKIILTNGFIKRTQKTPKNEIDLAKKYRIEYESRKQL